MEGRGGSRRGENEWKIVLGKDLEKKKVGVETGQALGDFLCSNPTMFFSYSK